MLPDNDTSMTAMESEWGRWAVSLLAIFLAVFIVVAALGNLLVMLSIIITRKHCDRGYIFIFNLSLVDFLTAVCVMPISMVTLLNGHFIFSDTVCQFNGFSVQMLFITSIHTLMYMAVYRYMTICNPFTPVHLCKIGVMIIASWTWAVIVSSLSMDVLSRFAYKIYTTQCGPGYPTEIHGWINVAIVAGACFVIPLAVIICVYILLFRKASKLFTRLDDPSYSNYSHEAHAEQRSISITFIIIVIGFIICWTPIFSYLNYASLIEDKASIPTLINPIVYWFSYLNSAINPFIYGLRTPIFKRLRAAICGCHGEEKHAKSFHTSSLSLSHTLQSGEMAKSKLAAKDLENISVTVEENSQPQSDNSLLPT